VTRSETHTDRPAKVILPAGLVVGVLGLVLAWLSIHSFFPAPTVAGAAKFVAAVLFAPFFLIFFWPSGHVGPSFIELAFPVLALVAVPVHPFVRRSWAAPVSLLGFLAWFLCELLVVAAPA
jgi:hypothetical protein